MAALWTTAGKLQLTLTDLVNIAPDPQKIPSYAQVGSSGTPPIKLTHHHITCVRSIFGPIFRKDLRVKFSSSWSILAHSLVWITVPMFIFWVSHQSILFYCDQEPSLCLSSGFRCLECIELAVNVSGKQTFKVVFITCSMVSSMQTKMVCLKMSLQEFYRYSLFFLGFL